MESTGADMATAKSTIRVGHRNGKIVVTKPGKGLVDKVLKKLGK